MHRSPCKLDLEGETADPDDEVEHEDEADADERPCPAGEGHEVQDVSDDDGADHGAEAREEGDEGSGPAVEEEGGDGSLVCVDCGDISRARWALSNSSGRVDDKSGYTDRETVKGVENIVQV